MPITVETNVDAPSRKRPARVEVGESKEQKVQRIVTTIIPLIPEQAPLHCFVHHNTLHGFEDLEFEEAVIEAGEILGAQPFQSEAAFAACIASGRITAGDLDAVVPQGDDVPAFQGGLSRRAFRRARLNHLFPVPSRKEVRWLKSETPLCSAISPLVDDARRAELATFAQRSNGGVSGMLEGLWQRLQQAASRYPDAPVKLLRRRDQILTATGVDTDQRVHSLLIRCCAAYLDQGVAYWTMPQREMGFLNAFRELYCRPVPPPDRLFRGLATTLRTQHQEGWTAERTIIWALEKLDVSEEQWPAYIRATLLSLRGWAGMMHQMDERPDRAPVQALPASLLDFAAVQLILDTVAAHNAMRDMDGITDFSQLPDTRPPLEPTTPLELMYEAFLLAQLLPVSWEALEQDANVPLWMDEVAAFDEVTRRRFLHRAYERRHAVEVLDGIAGHCRLGTKQAPPPKFQAVFCIDDREESIRRHLEEICPQAETFGYAGFFGVAMNYQGMDDVRPRPLCPVAIRPKHLVREEAKEEPQQRRYRSMRRRIAGLIFGTSVGSKTLVRGSILSTVVGLVALIPLVGRILFPRLAHQLAHWWMDGLAERPPTRLLLERESTEEDDEIHFGYTQEERCNIVHSALRTMGFAEYCPLVLIVGHGSSSLNNPHESAHDCGATGGGRGGPNARAFATMANDPRIRSELASRGTTVPDSTWFVGGYHNTCDDSMEYYDMDLLPSTHREAFEHARKQLEEACRWDAHERCRRFETSPPKLDVSRALSHAQTHANDLAEPRPEYGHATNAVCIVGRREKTRGLYLDRRAFLVSYDANLDANGDILTQLLLAVGPVGAGISLEYYFSFVDPVVYGCGTKLPHNITGLLGVMDGHASDLRTGLPWQMVEIHEPVRLLNIIEAELHVVESILAEQPALHRLVYNGWIRLAVWQPDDDQLYLFEEGAFHPYVPESPAVTTVERSVDHYGGKRQHLGPAHVLKAFGLAGEAS